MNCLLLAAHELGDDAAGGGQVVVRGRRAEHARKVLGARVGQALRVGVRGGQLGQGTVLRIERDELALAVQLDRAPPAKLPVTLLLALPRPKVLSRLLAQVTSLGVARVVLMNAWRVEKAYWQSEHLLPAALAAAIDDGLEQAVDTMPPEVTLERLFVPFVRERLPALAAGATCLVAHPHGGLAAPRGVDSHLVLAVGPEGGFIQAELDSLAGAGFGQVTLGPRVLRVETAICALVGRLAP